MVSLKFTWSSNTQSMNDKLPQNADNMTSFELTFLYAITGFLNTQFLKVTGTLMLTWRMFSFMRIFSVISVKSIVELNSLSVIKIDLPFLIRSFKLNSFFGFVCID